MRIHLKRFFASVSMTALTLSIAFAPAVSAMSPTTSFGTQSSVQKVLYGFGAYECIQNGTAILQDTAIGAKISTIIVQDPSAKVFVGPWIGDKNGMITCQDAITKALGNGQITEAMLANNEIFSGVYEKGASYHQTISCHYSIINSEAKNLIGAEPGNPAGIVYTWPQGFYEDNGVVDKRNHEAYSIDYSRNEGGAFNINGDLKSNMNEQHILDSINGRITDWKSPTDICKTIVQYGQIYPFSYTPMQGGDQQTGYAEILSSTDSTPFDEWGLHVDDAYHAWLVEGNNSNFKAEVKSSNTTSQIVLTGNAKSKLLANISRLYLGNSTSIDSFLNSHPPAKYILYGRYLFNGDGHADYGCGGTTIEANDPNIGKLNSQNDYWDVSQSYIAQIKAYRNNKAVSKASFLTKFGGNGISEPGSTKTLNYPGVLGDCKALANTFNNITLKGTNPESSAKTVVKNYINVTTVDDLPAANDTADDDKDPETSQGSPCSQAAGSLGWIVCSVLDLFSKATDGVYNYIENNFLQIDPDFITSTRSAWDIFRDWANIIFVIVFVIIILSQITGLGVSNYGIKKILPTLIMVAILVNLSFFLCEILVDLSNIAGYSLNKVFVDIAESTGVMKGDAGLGNMIRGLALTFLEGAGTVIGVRIAFASIESWIMPFLLALLIGFISILTFFMLLGVRQGGIIILVALAPVAVICYALPNTKKVFERWWKIFAALLLVYPICGALMGGCQFASRLMLGAGSSGDDSMKFSYALVAILLQAVPIFFVPSIVRSSMTTMGNIGTRLSNLGNGFGRRISGAIRKSDAYRDQRVRLRAHQAQRTLNREDKLNDYYQKHSFLGTLRSGGIGRRLRSGNGRLAEMATNSYNRRQERRINAVAAQRRANQNAAFVTAGGLDDAERRERNAAMQNYESTYRGNDEFMSSLQQQSAAYEAAIDAVDRDSNNINAHAELRALQNILGETADGQDIIQNVLNHRLADAQSRGDTSLSAGMVAAGQTLMTEHGGGFKSTNRALGSLAKSLANGDTLEKDAQGNYVKGKFGATSLLDPNNSNKLRTDAAGNELYMNDTFGSDAAKGSATELAGANDSTLLGMLQSIQNGSMDMSKIETAYRNASEAIANDNISVKPETERYLNQIRKAAYDKMRSDYATKNSGTFYDNKGRSYEYDDATGYYIRHDDSGDKQFQIGAGGDMMNIDNGKVIKGSRMVDAGRRFDLDHGGGFQELHSGMKIQH